LSISCSLHPNIIVVIDSKKLPLAKRLKAINTVKSRIAGAKSYFNEQLLKHQQSLIIFKAVHYFTPLKYPDLNFDEFAQEIKALPFIDEKMILWIKKVRCILL